MRKRVDVLPYTRTNQLRRPWTFVEYRKVTPDSLFNTLRVYCLVIAFLHLTQEMFDYTFLEVRLTPFVPTPLYWSFLDARGTGHTRLSPRDPFILVSSGSPCDSSTSCPFQLS